MLIYKEPEANTIEVSVDGTLLNRSAAISDYTRDTLGLRQRIIGLGDGLSRLQARVLGLVPGKPFTLDNYHSLQRSSTCQDNALQSLGITPTQVQAVVPGYLAAGNVRDRYDEYRRHSRRT